MIERLDEFCTAALAAHGCASVSLAVVARDEPVFTRAYGLADVADQRPATPETVYGLASITKAFTATAACLAAEDGLLDLDAPIPGRFRWTAPTSRQLLQHRGGFPAFHTFHYGTGPSIIDIDDYRTLVRQPGSGFEYSNSGYREVGDLLATATGMDLGSYLRTRVAAPLGLASFGYGSDYPGTAPVAQRYTADGRAYDTCHTSHPAASAGWATAADVALFARTVSNLLAPASVTTKYDAVPVNERSGYGLGWVVSHGAGPVTRSHGGGMGGIATMMIDLPEREVSVAVLTNSTNKAARDAIVGFVVGALAPGFANEQVNPITERTRPMSLPPGEWAGEISTMEGDVPLRLGVRTGGQVELRLADGAPVTVAADASDRWDLRLTAPLQLPTTDARLNSPSLILELRAAPDGLVGRATAFKDGDNQGWLGAFLGHSCALRSR